jgi:hypothetical protein
MSSAASISTSRRTRERAGRRLRVLSDAVRHSRRNEIQGGAAIESREARRHDVPPQRKHRAVQRSREHVQTVSTDGYDKVITIIMTDGEENSSRE